MSNSSFTNLIFEDNNKVSDVINNNNNNNTSRTRYTLIADNSAITRITGKHRCDYVGWTTMS